MNHETSNGLISSCHWAKTSMMNNKIDKGHCALMCVVLLHNIY